MSSLPTGPQQLAPPRRSAGRRATDRTARVGTTTAQLVRAAVVLPVRSRTWWVVVLAGAVCVAETVGLVVRLACRGGACATWTHRLDMDALGSVPRGLITVVLAAVALSCLVAVVRAGRQGAAVWWATLAAGSAVLAAAKNWSVHSLLEERLGALLPGADVQLLFLLASVAGLSVAVLTGRWVRRDTRTAVVTWLGLYALASVGLAAVSVVLGGLGEVPGDLSTWVEETGEGLAAVGLLAVARSGAAVVSRRARPDAAVITPSDRFDDEE